MIAAVCLVAAPKPADNAINGKWEVLEDWHDGKLLKSPGKVIKTFENGIVTESVTPKPNVFLDVDSKITFRVTPGKPQQIDYTTYVNGKKLGNGEKGIFEIDGDSMKISVAFPKEERPTDFKPGAKKRVLILKRITDDAED